MKFKGKETKKMSLQELQAADWELAGQEYKFNEAIKHPKFEKLNPLPTISPSFVALRTEIKKEMENKNV